jgi:hypothetical protein
MYQFLLTCAAIAFLTHVILLLVSFSKGRFFRSRYFFSHFTLWLTGVVVFSLAMLYAGKGVSGFLDYFDTDVKRVTILVVTVLVSALAHGIVKFLVLPSMHPRTAPLRSLK